uniref:DNA-directed RNA polymerase III subunit RPC4 n=1 Tax=Anthurium amnicola TaxID=1678845 RepID=A0A1D1XF31_9ARAE
MSFGISRTEKNDEDGADATVARKKDYVEPWDYYSNYPVTLPLRRPYLGDPELLDEEEFGEASSGAEYDESKINSAEVLGLKDDSVNGRMLFFQLPVSLPLGRRPDVTAKGKEVGGKRAGVSEKGCSLDDLPAGFMGKMLVYKNGAVKMKLGDAVFDVSPGSECIFAQDVMAINTQQKHCCVLGELNKRAIVRPDVDSLLSSLSEMN